MVSASVSSRERAGILLVVLMSLSLLLYVAWGEMVRTNLRFQTERLQSQGQPLHAALQSHVQSGLAVEQFAGFTVLSAEMQAVDPQLRSVGMEAPAGRWLFDTQPPGADSEVVRLPVRTRFETVGWLHLAVDGDAAKKPVRAYAAVLVCSAVIFGLLAFWRLLHAALQPDPFRAQRRILIALLLAQTCVVTTVMWQVYSSGARSVAQSQANALVSRLAEVYLHGLVFDDFSDIADVLTQERARSRHVQQLSVRVNDNLVFRSRDARSGLDQMALTELSAQRQLDAGEPVRLAVSLSVPVSVIGMEIARNLKNFAFLFVATVFAALLMLRLLHGFAAEADRPIDAAERESRQAGTETLKVAALLFMSVFCDQLSAAFLPPWIAGIAQGSGYPSGSAAWAFTAYFVAFALALLPAQRQAAAGRSRGVLMLGATLVCTGALLLAYVPGFLTVILARVCSGVGQGMVFVAAQSLLLAWSRYSGSLGANTSIVFQFNAGMICGLALGSLLVVYLEPAGVFTLVAVLALLVVLLASGLLAPPVHGAPGDTAHEAASDARRQRQRSWQYWRDPGFAMPALFIGIPSKAVMTGVLVYGLPLLLASAGLEREETGQLLLFYAVGVLLCNGWIGRLKPATARLRTMAALAMCVSGLAIAVLAAALTGQAGWLPIALVLLAVLVLGITHGAINAPVVTLVSASHAARNNSGATVATYYRLVERAGHVAGPALFSTVLLSVGDAASALQWLAMAVGAMGLVALLWGWRASSAVVKAGGRVSGFFISVGLGFVVSLACHSEAATQTPKRDAVQEKAQAAVQERAQAVSWLSLSPAVSRQWELSRTETPSGESLLIKPKASAASADLPMVVMMIFKPSPAYDTAVSRMLEVWAEKGLAVNVSVTHAGTDPASAHAVVDAAVRKRAALLVGVGSDTTAFLHEHYRKGKIPLLSVCAKDPVLMGQMPSYEHGSGTSMAYTSLNSPVDVQLTHLLQVRPGLQDLAIIVDRRNTSAWQTQTLPLEKRATESGITVHKVIVDGQQEVAAQLQDGMRSILSAMRRNDANGAASAFWITGSSSVFPHLRLINEIAGSVPVFSAVPDLVKPGPDSADVSIGVSFEENAYLAALYAQRILQGQTLPGGLPVGVVSPPEIAINFMKTRQSGLRLPFSFFEKAGTVFNAQGERIRWRGSRVKPDTTGGS